MSFHRNGFYSSITTLHWTKYVKLSCIHTLSVCWHDPLALGLCWLVSVNERGVHSDKPIWQLEWWRTALISTFTLCTCTHCSSQCLQQIVHRPVPSASELFLWLITIMRLLVAVKDLINENIHNIFYELCIDPWCWLFDILPPGAGTLYNKS